MCVCGWGCHSFQVEVSLSTLWVLGSNSHCQSCCQSTETSHQHIFYLPYLEIVLPLPSRKREGLIFVAFTTSENLTLPATLGGTTMYRAWKVYWKATAWYTFHAVIHGRVGLVVVKLVKCTHVSVSNPSHILRKQVQKSHSLPTIKEK